ncbi:putative malate dehydrogenase [Xylariaceae sp. FL0662B]|nr:putative malate dehydrogenase [Xylariaceae sp. FL0662B]
MYVNITGNGGLAQTLLSKAGLPDEHARLMADCLVQADARGVDTHGLARLQQYMGRVSSGLVKAKPDLKLSEKTPVAAHLDGDNGFGFIVASRGMEEAIKRAETYGIGIVTVYHSNHFGMGATYVLQALKKGLISLNEVPYILDMAPSVVAKGKIRKAARRGEKIPLGWAYDKSGKPTEDANEALNGSMAPIGGPKGCGIAILMDIMSGVLSGAAFGGEVGDQYKESRPQNVGHCFIAIKPDVFLSADEFRSRIDILVQRVHGVAPADGVKEVLFPGEPECRLDIQRRSQGLPFADAEKVMFDDMAEKFGIPKMTMSTTPLTLSREKASSH